VASLLHQGCCHANAFANARARPNPRVHGCRAAHASIRDGVFAFLDLKRAVKRRNIQNIDASEAIMPDTRYYIVRHDMVWLIKFEDEEYGPYETQDEALRLASDAAEQLERHGESVEVHLVGL
jgi:hypothetical protein